MTNDRYTASVGFYDLWHEDGHVPEVRAALPALLSGVRRSVLEIGAGTGLITLTIADAVPGEVFALEPSDGMRNVLLSRLAERRDLLPRVTVLPYGALDLDLDEQVEAVVMIAVLYHFTPSERVGLWELLGEKVEPGGLLVFNWRERPPLVERPLRLDLSSQVGRHTYEMWSEILDDTTARWVYRVTQGDRVISETSETGRGYRVSLEQLRKELNAAGFDQADAPEPLYAWRRGK
ncbi:class I SAM-dependent methyltransferase [Nonomuraea sp. NPDC050556]|uniref:class I SAM-dependent methyltransferase n=1 Tax=Nonomuraea sp. NPDC050556 TaxID=3364369 RepID=UPI0037A0D8D8